MASEEKKKLGEAILSLLEKREEGKTICPSEAAREAFPEDWRSKMPLCRKVARELAQAGKIEICQRGKAVSPDEDFRGPIRLR